MVSPGNNLASNLLVKSIIILLSLLLPLGIIFFILRKLESKNEKEEKK